MADFSLTSFFVVPVGQTALPSAISTQDLTAGQLGVFTNAYLATATPQNYPYFYIAQGRASNYLQGSKRSDKIKGCAAGTPCNSNVTEWYKTKGCNTPLPQVTDIDTWEVKCGDIVTLTIRAHSSYIDSLYFNGLTRSVTVQAPCCDCGDDPCDNVDVDNLIDAFIAKLALVAPGINPDNLMLSHFFTFERVGTGVTAKLRITGKLLDAYGQPCDVAAFPHQYDRLWFRTFVYAGPATTADFIVSDACNIVAVSTIMQNSVYLTGTSDEIKQLEKNYYSYQTGLLKHLYRMVGYNEVFESYVTDGQVYDIFYIKFNEFDRSAYSYGDFVPTDSMVQIACISGGAFSIALQAVLELALGTLPVDDTCPSPTITTTTTLLTTTTTTTVRATTTTTTTHA